MSLHPAISTETYREKALRKFKQQPLVPVGAAATTVALVIAMTKMRKGQSRSLNNWLRVRILAQGLTVAAVVVGSWAYGTAKPTTVPDVAAAQDKAAQDREAFQMRLRLAEEATRAESGVSSTTGPQSSTSVAVPAAVLPSASTTSTSWRSWWKWNNSKGSNDRPS